MYSFTYRTFFCTAKGIVVHKTLSVTSARQQLLKLTKDIGRRMDQVVLTNKGEAQAVLLSMGEYNSLRAAAELASHPEARSASEEGFEQLRRREGVTLAEAMPGPAGARKRTTAAPRVEALSNASISELKLPSDQRLLDELSRALERGRERVRQIVAKAQRKTRRSSAASHPPDLNAG